MQIFIHLSNIVKRIFFRFLKFLEIADNFPQICNPGPILRIIITFQIDNEKLQHLNRVLDLFNAFPDLLSPHFLLRS